MSSDNSDKKPGASTIIRRLAQDQIGEMRDIRDGVKKMEIQSIKDEATLERRLAELERDLIRRVDRVERDLVRRFDEAARKHRERTEAADREHAERLVAVEKELAVSRAKAGGIAGAVSGGGVGAIVVLAKTMLFG